MYRDTMNDGWSAVLEGCLHLRSLDAAEISNMLHKTSHNCAGCKFAVQWLILQSLRASTLQLGADQRMSGVCLATCKAHFDGRQYRK